MAEFVMKDMTGSIFVNERKEQPKHPDFTGKVMIEGVVWRLSAWKRQTKAGKGYLSIAVREMNGNEGNREEKKSADPWDL